MTTTTESELPATTLESATSLRWWRVLAAFLVGLGLAVILIVAGVLAYEQAHAGEIGAGVHAGSVDLSGLTRAQAAARLSVAYGSLGEGELTLTLPEGTSTVSYAELGRELDVNAVIDSALAVGRTGSPFERVADELRTAVRGTNISLAVTFDQAALKAAVARIAASAARPAVSAVVTSGKTGFVGSTSEDGRTLEPDALTRQVMTALDSLNAPGRQAIDLSTDLVAVPPTVSTADAAATAASGNAQVAPIVLSQGSDTWTIPAATVASWLTVVTTPSGGYAIEANPTKVTAALTALASKVNQKAVDASFLISKQNKVVGVVAGKDGRTLDVATSLGLVQGLLAVRAQGVVDTTPLAAGVTTVAPSLTTAAATSAAPQMKAISSWTTYYAPGAHNGNSANITIPALAIDGTIVAPGAKFDFWKAVGEVSLAKGYKLGGAIINGHSVEGKTIGGGICSTSTTLFNAALRAGLKMGLRANHYYYISRYPLGLDATVWEDGSAVQNMTFTNDTAYPILIRAYAKPGIVRFTLYSVPTGRTVTLSKPIVKNFIQGYTKVEYTKSLKPGQSTQEEYQANGMDTWVTRTVRDKTGKVIDQETFYSHYARMI
ncbi:MAG: VanW family protein, partial [Candidatus Limnocylindrales bacterium]